MLERCILSPGDLVRIVMPPGYTGLNGYYTLKHPAGTIGVVVSVTRREYLVDRIELLIEGKLSAVRRREMSRID